jgi:hypothetical protein
MKNKKRRQKMHCPKCHGKGRIPMYQLENVQFTGSGANRLTQCDYEGCHGIGIIHCCEGLIEESKNEGKK